MKVINEFLNNWKATATEYYATKNAELVETHAKFDEMNTIKGIRAFFPVMSDQLRRKFKELSTEAQELHSESMRFRAAFSQAGFEIVAATEKNRAALIEAEAEAKRKKLIQRVEKVTGKIIDANGLYIAPTGELNGTVKGEKTSANVQTIAAGGYNIQCFHYRVKVKAI